MVVGPNDLIIAKIIWIQGFKSEKQVNDIENLLLNPNKDINYINKWCETLNLETYNILDNE